LLNFDLASISYFQNTKRVIYNILSDIIIQVQVNKRIFKLKHVGSGGGCVGTVEGARDGGGTDDRCVWKRGDGDVVV
jgi:hypothetical protein